MVMNIFTFTVVVHGHHMCDLSQYNAMVMMVDIYQDNLLLAYMYIPVTGAV